jgi:hypothetical protein
LCDWPTTTWDCRAGLQPPGLPSVATNSTPGLVRAVRLAGIDERLSAGVATIGKPRVRDARDPQARVDRRPPSSSVSGRGTPVRVRTPSHEMSLHARNTGRVCGGYSSSLRAVE